MLRHAVMAILTAALLAGCGVPQTGGATRGTVGVTRYSEADEAKVQFRMLDSVNALRAAAGAAPLRLSGPLNAAAKTHSIDMARQNRPWHFGSDGSSPLARVQRAGYRGGLAGEAISETYENDVQTLSAWMQEPGTKAVILDRTAREMGLGFYQQSDGKLWWTLVMGYPAGAGAVNVPTPGVPAVAGGGRPAI